MDQTDLKELERLLELTWGKGSSMISYCMKTSKYIKINDLFVSIGTQKPTITKTIWYDDTGSAPDANWANFERLNKQNNMPEEWENQEKRYTRRYLYFGAQYYGDKTNGKLAGVRYADESDQDYESLRKVTDEELIIINAAIRELQTDYEKRLKNYFKRYSNHVTSSGYWADR